MTRWHATIAVVLVAGGTLLASRGPAGVSGLLRFIGGNAEAILLGAAGIVLLVTLIPRNRLVLVTALVGGALAIHVVRERLWVDLPVWTLAGTVAAAAGGWSIVRRSAQSRDWSNPVQRVTAVTGERTFRVPADRSAPAHLVVNAIGGNVVVDMRLCRPSGNRLTEIAVTCLRGDVKIFAREDWYVVAGRTGPTVRVKFSGLLNERVAFPYPFESLPELIAGADAHRSPSGQSRSGIVVVHSVGVAGRIDVVDRRPP